jgi:hypothetical protein
MKIKINPELAANFVETDYDFLNIEIYDDGAVDIEVGDGYSYLFSFAEIELIYKAAEAAKNSKAFEGSA